jgi:hypothetical protein
VCYINAAQISPETIQISSMKVSGISMTCKAAFEAIAETECWQLQILLDQKEKDAALMQAENQILRDEIDFLNATCVLLHSRLA